mmetsp:Transcript_17097/g.30524  ORF Transcript_17097/g.30524 Transcript_17097/m.30524 type:complete len:97 (-) Transcript_17097:611-901(-)
MALSGVLQMVFMFGLLGNLIGPYILPEAAGQWIQENRTLCIMTVLVSNFMAGQLMATGAFEVEYNGLPVFSKLKTGHMIDFQELARLMDQTMIDQA